MAHSFDPYHQWLGISPKDQPPNHYRLLGVDLFESDLDVISNAADQRMAHVRSFQTGQHAAEDGERIVGLALGNRERRQQTHHLRAGRRHQQAFPQAGMHDPQGRRGRLRQRRSPHRRRIQ